MPRPLITARDVERSRDLVVPAGALLTPLARDLLRKRGALPVARPGGARRVQRLVVANWKSHKTIGEARAFADELRGLWQAPRARAVVCPTFVCLAALREALGDLVDLGAQDISPHEEGAHTGEVAARHLVDAGCRFALVGHSERRLAGEDDERVRAKLRATLRGGLQPILCVGETRDERRARRTEAVIRTQLEGALGGLGPDELARCVVAYEPRWAIGTGLTPSLADVGEVLAHVREVLLRVGQEEAARGVPLLYGGSVNESNAAELLGLPGCAGALVGGASLSAARFAAILGAP